MKVLVTGADRGLGFGLTKKLLERGYLVYAGQFMPEWTELNKLAEDFPDTLTILPLDVGSDESVENAYNILKNAADSIDIIINNAGITGAQDNVVSRFTDTGMMADVYNVNAVGAVRVVEHFMPLLEKGEAKRLCFISSEAGSVTQSKRNGFFWYCMTKSALNMYVKILFNKLRPKGFCFRLYHPGWVKSYMSGKLNENAVLPIEDAADYAIGYLIDSVIDEDELHLHGYDGEVFEF